MAIDQEQIGRMVSAANSKALEVHGHLHCAQSWCRPVDPEDDERDPFEMRTVTLKQAEDGARELLEFIGKIRAANVAGPSI